MHPRGASRCCERSDVEMIPDAEIGSKMSEKHSPSHSHDVRFEFSSNER